MINIFINIILLILLVWKFRLNERLIADPFVIILSFSALYSLIPCIYLLSESDLIGLKNLPLIEKEIYLQLLNYISIVYLLLLLLPFSKNLILFSKKINKEKSTKVTILLFLSIYLVSIILAYFYPWPQFNEEFQFGHSLVALSKYFLLVSMVKLFTEERKYLIWISFVLFYCYVEKSRTFLIQSGIIFLLTSNIRFQKLLRYLPLLIFSFFFLTVFTLDRTGIEISFESIFKGAFWVLSSETIFSTYATIQSIDFQNIIDLKYTFEERFIIPFYSIFTLYINPSDLFQLLFNYSSKPFYDFIALHVGRIGVMGGHYFLAEHLFRFQYLFPFTIILEFLCFDFILRKIKTVQLHILIAGISFMIVKSPIIVITKTILFLFIAIKIYHFAHKSLTRVIV